MKNWQFPTVPAKTFRHNLGCSFYNLLGILCKEGVIILISKLRKLKLREIRQPDNTAQQVSSGARP